MTDERQGDALWSALERLPRGAGIVFRHYTLARRERRLLFDRVRRVARRRGLLLVADEVINGFGRLGTMFACDYYGIEPDILVLSKQITSSYQPLAAILMSDAVFQAIADNTAKIGTFGHGFTDGAHPVAMAVGLENIDIIEERGLVANAAAMGEILQRELRHGQDHCEFGPRQAAMLLHAAQ